MTMPHALKRRAFLASTAALAVPFPGFAQESSYPNRPLKWVVPFPAGGGLDAITRAVGEQVASKFGQPVVIDNRPGAAGTIGAAYVAAAPADGYTLMSIDNGSYTTAQHFFSKLSYQPTRDLRLIATMVRLPVVLIVPGSSPFKSYSDFASHAKANPEKLNYASPGQGTPLHTGMELLQIRTGMKLTHVPYKGMPPILTDLVAGLVDAALVDYGSAKAFLDSGRLRMLAVATERRLGAAPAVPTFEEAGVHDLPISLWHSVVAPAKLPDQIAGKLADVVHEALGSPPVVKQMESVGAEAFFKTGSEGKTYVSEQVALWDPIARGLGIRLD